MELQNLVITSNWKLDFLSEEKLLVINIKHLLVVHIKQKWENTLTFSFFFNLLFKKTFSRLFLQNGGDAKNFLIENKFYLFLARVLPACLIQNQRFH